MNKISYKEKIYKKGGGWVFNIYSYFSTLALSLLLLLMASNASAELELHISKTSSDEIPIYIANFAGGLVALLRLILNAVVALRL